MKLDGWEAVEYTATDGTKRLVLVDGGTLPEQGIPLLDLGPLGLPEDIEQRLIEHLWARGIREYRDVLKPNSAEVIASAIRAAVKVAVSEIKTLAQREQKLLEEAGYE